MEIQFLGQSCFRIRDKKITLITDPYNPAAVGFKLPKNTADIVTISHDHADHNNAASIGGASQRKTPFIVFGPGEYEISGVFIFGIPSFHDNREGKKRGKNIIYVVEMDNLRLVHLGDLGHRLDDQQLEAVSGADVLFVPVGGTYTIDSSQAVEVVNQIGPKIIIPMHYQIPGLIFALSPVEEFLKKMGFGEIEKRDKLVISYDKLPEEKEVVVLNARH